MDWRPDEADRTFLAELSAKRLARVARSRRCRLNRDDWTPHPKSMPLGRLAGLVATMPSWIPMIIDQDELDLTPAPGAGQCQPPALDKLAEVHDGHVAKARESLAEDQRRLPDDDQLAAQGRRPRGHGAAAARRAARNADAPRPSPRTADGVPAPVRPAGAVNLRPDRRRSGSSADNRRLGSLPPQCVRLRGSRRGYPSTSVPSRAPSRRPTGRRIRVSGDEIRYFLRINSCDN